MRLVFGKNKAVADFIQAKSGVIFSPVTSMFAVLNEAGTLIGGVAFVNYTGAGIELAGAGSVIISRTVRQAIGDYAFGWLGCKRLQITTRRSNKTMRKLAPRLGFVFEGRARSCYGDEDGLVYSLLSHEAIERGHWTPKPEGYRVAA